MIEPPSPSIESLRKHARILVIDDFAFPAQGSFRRDGYHFERWSAIKNLSQLTDGHYDVILLDIQGVGLKESPELQGLGILGHIKKLNPAQPVILYSSAPQKISSREHLVLADAVLDKSASYIEYKNEVDSLLLRKARPGYFISAMNRELGDQAILTPRAVKLASRAISGGNPQKLERYLKNKLPDVEQVDRILSIVSIGASAVGMFTL